MLSKRLLAIASFVSSKDNLVDVGCDHALLPIFLVKEGIVQSAIVSDCLESALENAKKNIKKANLENKITPIISWGLRNIDLNSINTIIISGMGTKTIIDILSDNEKLMNIDKLIIQSNNDYLELRKKITRLGYKFEDETITFDKGKYYITIMFIKGRKKYYQKDYRLGIIKKDNIDYYLYLKKDYEKIFMKIPYRKIRKRFRMLLNILELQKIIKKISEN